MRIAVSKHTNFRTSLDYTEIMEVNSVKKEKQDDRCWLNVDGMAFEMPEEQADKFVEEAFNAGILDLRGLGISSIPW